MAGQCTYRDVYGPALSQIDVVASLQAHIHWLTDQPSLLLDLAGLPIPTLSLTRHLHLGGASRVLV